MTPRIALFAGSFLCVIGILAINALGYFAPPGYWSFYGNNQFAAPQYLQALGWSAEPIALASFIALLRLAIAAAWVGYVIMLLVAVVWPSLVGRWLTALGLALALVIGFATPPWLSSDVYSYILYGRVHALHGLNPYLDLPSRLGADADPISKFVFWDATSRYGPLWTLLTSGFALILGASSVVVQMSWMKLVATVSHCALALGVSRLSADVMPRLRPAAFMLIAFSPLFVTEGPGNAHNDILMLALAAWGVVFWQRGWPKRACLMLGAAGAVKFIAFGLPLWFLGRRLYEDVKRWPSAAALACLAFAPFLLLEFYFVKDLTSLFAVFQFTYAGTPSPTALPDTSMLVPFLLLALACSLMVIFGRLMHWTFAWTFLTFGSVAMIGPAWPWYLMWPGIFIFAGYSKFLSYAVFPYIACCVYLMYWYSVVA